MEPTIHWVDQKFSAPPGRRRGEQAGAQGRLRVRRDDRDLPHALPRQAGEAAARDLPEHHRQRGDGARLPGGVEAGRPTAVLRQLPDHPGQRHPPPAVGLQGVRRQDLPGRGRDRRDRRGHRGELRRCRSGLTASSGPGIALKTEAMGLAVMVELPLVVIDVQRAGPVDRHADQERAGGPAPGHVRAQLRLADPDRRAGDARANASTSPSRPCRIALKYMTPVVYLSDAFLATGSEPWRIPDVADLPDIRVANAVEGRRSVPAVPARPGDAGPAVGGPGHGRARAPHRRAREGRRDRQRQLRPGQPPPDAAAAPGQGRGHRQGHPAARGLRPVERRPADPRLGVHLRRHPVRGRAPAREGRVRRPRAPAPPQPVPGEHRVGPAVATAGC